MRLEGKAWEWGKRGRPGNEARGEGLGMRLEGKAWE